MTPSTDLRRTIQSVLATHKPRPPRTVARCAAPESESYDAPRDPDWALREIVDDVMFETVR